MGAGSRSPARGPPASASRSRRAVRRTHALDCSVRRRGPPDRRGRPRGTLGRMTTKPDRALAPDRLRAFSQDAWDARIVPTLEEYVRIPAKSPGFDRDWQAHGHLDQAVELAASWGRQRPVEGLHVEVVRLPGRTPVLLMEVPGTGEDTVLLYGHL